MNVIDSNQNTNLVCAGLKRILKSETLIWHIGKKCNLVLFEISIFQYWFLPQEFVVNLSVSGLKSISPACFHRSCSEHLKTLTILFRHRYIANGLKYWLVFQSDHLKTVVVHIILSYWYFRVKQSRTQFIRKFVIEMCINFITLILRSIRI